MAVPVIAGVFRPLAKKGRIGLTVAALAALAYLLADEGALPGGHVDCSGLDASLGYGRVGGPVRLVGRDEPPGQSPVATDSSIRVAGEGGLLIPGTRVFVGRYGPSGEMEILACGMTGPTGVYTVPGGIRGVAWIGLQPPAGSPYAEAIFKSMALEPGSLGSLEIGLSPGKRIKGLVKDPDGRPVVGAQVRLRPMVWVLGFENDGWQAGRDGEEAQSAGPAMAFLRTVETDGSGAFEFSGVAETEYALAVDPPPPYAVLRLWGIVPSERQVTYTVSALAKPAPVITVVDAEQRPVAGAGVSVWDWELRQATLPGPRDRTGVDLGVQENGRVCHASGRTDDLGTVQFEHVWGDRQVSLGVLPPSEREHELGYMGVRSWDGENARVVLPKLGDVSGRLFSQDPTAVYIVFQSEVSEAFRCVDVDARTGDFSFRGVPVGPARLWVDRRWRPVGLDSEAVPIEVPASGIVLTYAPLGSSLEIAIDPGDGWSRGLSGRVTLGCEETSETLGARLVFLQDQRVVVRWEDLPADLTYWVVVHDRGESIGVARRLRTGRREVPVQPGPLQRIEGEVVAPHEPPGTSLCVFGFTSFGFTVIEDVSAAGEFMLAMPVGGPFQLELRRRDRVGGPVLASREHESGFVRFVVGED